MLDRFAALIDARASESMFRHADVDRVTFRVEASESASF
jgi:hypothetical protein